MGRKKRRWRKQKELYGDMSPGRLVAWADWTEEEPKKFSADELESKPSKESRADAAR